MVIYDCLADEESDARRRLEALGGEGNGYILLEDVDSGELF
jgi:hypothetical protein